MISFPSKIWKHAFSATCICMFSELIWKFPTHDVKICHESEPKHLTANPLLKSESPRWTDFCSISGTLPRIFFKSHGISEEIYKEFLDSFNQCSQTLSLRLGPTHYVWLFPSSYKFLTSSIFSLGSLVCSLSALVWTQSNLEAAAFFLS